MKKLFLFFLLSPVIGFSQINPNFIYTQTCFGSQTTLVASSSLADTSIASWQWDLDGNGTYDNAGKTIISLITISNSVPVKLRITPKSGTADSITKNVVIDPLPNVNFIANNLCEAKKAIYISQSTIASGSITQFKWDFNNDGVDDITGNDTAYYTCGPAQTYVTKLTCVSDKGCSAFTQKTTTVYPNPLAAFTSAGACENGTTAFTNTSTAVNPDFYLWKFGDGNNSATSGNANHTYASAGTYSVQLIAVTLEGCRDTASKTIIVNPKPNITISGDSSFCVFASVSLNAAGGISYLWNTGETDALIHSTIITSTTTYSVTGTDANGCTASQSFLVTMYPDPQITVSASTTVSSGQDIVLIAHGADTYHWSTGETSNSIIVTQSGTYYVRGVNLSGCRDTTSIVISAKNEGVVSVSGLILTPNDDNINDVLVIDNISQYTNCDLNIYNVWNEEVYSTKGYKNNWKGTNASGAELTAGPYYYIIKCDEKPLLKGNINILR